MINIITDSGGRRTGIDRRVFLYAVHLPERRSCKDRRGGFDRRCEIERRSRMQLTKDRRTYSKTVHINDIAYR